MKNVFRLTVILFVVASVAFAQNLADKQDCNCKPTVVPQPKSSKRHSAPRTAKKKVAPPVQEVASEPTVTSETKNVVVRFDFKSNPAGITVPVFFSPAGQTFQTQTQPQFQQPTQVQVDLGPMDRKLDLLLAGQAQEIKLIKTNIRWTKFGVFVGLFDAGFSVTNAIRGRTNNYGPTTINAACSVSGSIQQCPPIVIGHSTVPSTGGK